MNSKTLYVSDMDGTLLNNNSLVSPTTSAIVTELSRQGALITVATARTPATVDPLLQGTYTVPPAIVMTGAALWDRQRRIMTDARIMSCDTASRLCNLFASHGIDPFVYTLTNPGHLDVFHGTEMSHAEADFYYQRRDLTLKKFHLGQKPDIDALNRALLLFGIGATPQVTALASDLATSDDCSVSCYPDIHNPSRSLIEVFGSGVSKANAVKSLAARLGVERVVVFGDNLNDISMMKVADVAVAVDNAYPQVKEIADTVIGPNSADSVAHFIQQDDPY